MRLCAARRPARLAAVRRWVMLRRCAGRPGFGGAQVGEGSGGVVQRGTEVPVGEATHASRGRRGGCCGSWVLGAAGTRSNRAACIGSSSGGGRRGKQRRHGLAGIDGGSLRREQPQALRTSGHASAQQGAAANGHTSAMGAGRVAPACGSGGSVRAHGSMGRRRCDPPMGSGGGQCPIP